VKTIFFLSAAISENCLSFMPDEAMSRIKQVQSKIQKATRRLK
jgi:hypothetical protein